MTQSKRILVVGAGVSGLTVAKKLLQDGHSISILSCEAEGQLPSGSANAYAMWVPVRVDSDPRIEAWTDQSLAEFRQLAADPSYGICLRSIFQLKCDEALPWYASKLDSFRLARPDEISELYSCAHVIEQAPVIDPLVYLSKLQQEVLGLGASFQTVRLQGLGEVPGSYDLVVNCSSLGSRQLAADSTLFAQRMQVLKIKPNGFQHVVIDDEGPNKRACIVPHRDYIKLGAVFDLDAESLEVDDSLTEDILQRCKNMVPGFKAERSDILSVHRALRPERPLPRVEISALADGRPLIHNYGHDGMGYILSCGIAASINEWVACL